MPYVTQDRRIILKDIIDEVLSWMRYPMETDVAHYLRRMLLYIYFPKLFDGSAYPETQNQLDTIQGAIQQLGTIVNGDINYLLCMILIIHYDLDKNPRYSRIDGAVRALELLKDITQRQFNDLYEWIAGTIRCVELELYRRIAAPYEDLCIEKNGDII